MKESFKDEALDPYQTIAIVFVIIFLGLIFDSSPPLPDNCHITPSVDVGGEEIECD